MTRSRKLVVYRAWPTQTRRRTYSNAVHGLTASTLKAIAGAEDKEGSDEPAEDKISDIMEFEGAYRWPDYPMGVYIIPTAKGELQAIQLFSDNPASSPATYVHVEGDTFRYKRKDEDLGATLMFERDSKGEIVSLLFDGYRSLKMNH